jgi:hypothetical protein
LWGKIINSINAQYPKIFRELKEDIMAKLAERRKLLKEWESRLDVPAEVPPMPNCGDGRHNPVKWAKSKTPE